MVALLEGRVMMMIAGGKEEVPRRLRPRRQGGRAHGAPPAIAAATLREAEREQAHAILIIVSIQQEE